MIEGDVLIRDLQPDPNLEPSPYAWAFLRGEYHVTRPAPKLTLACELQRQTDKPYHLRVNQACVEQMRALLSLRWQSIKALVERQGRRFSEDMCRRALAHLYRSGEVQRIQPKHGGNGPAPFFYRKREGSGA